MFFKDGVKVNGVKPEIALALIACNDVFNYYGKQMVVTSVADGKHSLTSLHYVGFAFDLRGSIAWGFTESELNSIKKDLIEALTDEFDVILEKDHYHIEFQVKRS